MDGAYPVAAEAMHLEAYLLAALIVASPTLAGLEGNSPGLRWARQAFELSEVSRRMIGHAIMLRSMLNSSPSGSEAVVGRLVDAGGPERGLTLREACNKIVHAVDVDFSLGQWKKSEDWAVSRILVVEGEHHGKSWRAEVDSLAFLDAVVDKF